MIDTRENKCAGFHGDNLLHSVDTILRQGITDNTRKVIAMLCEYETQRYFESIVPPERKEPFIKHLNEIRDQLAIELMGFSTELMCDSKAANNEIR